jgi:hypothetical protein
MGGADAADALAAPIRIGDRVLASRLIATPPVRSGAGATALAGIATLGAGIILARGREDWTEVVNWIHAHTDVLVGMRLPGDASGKAVTRAIEHGFDVLAIDYEAPAIASWPTDKILIATLIAPDDPVGSDGDSKLSRLVALGGERPVIAGVSPSSASENSAALVLCERLKQEGSLTCAWLEGARNRTDALSALIAGRVDLVGGMPSQVSARWLDAASDEHIRDQVTDRPRIASQAGGLLSTLRRRPDTLTIDQLLISWGITLGETEEVTWFGPCASGETGGFALVTNRRLWFIELDQAGWREERTLDTVVAAEQFGGRRRRVRIRGDGWELELRGLGGGRSISDLLAAVSGATADAG